MVEFLVFHAHQVFIPTRKCTGISLAFAGLVFSFGWASKQLWFGGNSGQLRDKMANLSLQHVQHPCMDDGRSQKDPHLNAGTVKYHNKHIIFAGSLAKIMHLLFL